jgi:hypothetical protein
MLGVTRTCCMILKTLLIGGLAAWVLAAPLVWILRDGLGPKAVDSVGAQAVYRFAVGWGVPAFALAMPLAGLLIFEWLVTRREEPVGEGED